MHSGNKRSNQQLAEFARLVGSQMCVCVSVPVCVYIYIYKLYIYIHETHGDILSKFEERKCKVSQVNETVQKGDNTRTNKVSSCIRTIEPRLDYYATRCKEQKGSSQRDDQQLNTGNNIILQLHEQTVITLSSQT